MPSSFSPLQFTSIYSLICTSAGSAVEVLYCYYIVTVWHVTRNYKNRNTEKEGLVMDSLYIYIHTFKSSL